MKPNIVLITIDSLRADFVGYQNPQEKNTPFLDSFAGKSHVFTNAISPANPTFFTYCSVLTGTLPFTYGNYLGIPDKPGIKTIAQVLKEDGYSTFAFLADSPALYSEFGYNKGFDVYDDGYEEASKLSLSSGEILWKLRQATPDFFLRIIEIVRPFIKSIFASPQFSVPGKKLNEKVKRQFRIQKKEPFFLWLHYMDVHVPYYSGFNQYFFKSEKPIERIIKRIIFFKELATSLRKMKIKNNEVTQIFLEAYRSSVKYLDEALKEGIDFLQTKYPNTVFIITSDHGEAFMEHDFFGHEPLCLYNELIHVPLLIYVPSSRPKRVLKTVSLISLAKTISVITGIEELQFQGDNLLRNKIFSPLNNISRVLYKCRSPHVRLGILDNKTEIQGYSELWSFTTAKEKYIREKDGGIREYYRLDEDPQESKNLINDKIIGKTKIIKQLSKIIKETA